MSETDLSEIESGARGPQPRELARIATALELGADWFVTESPPAVRSLRADRVEGPQVARSDLLLEQMARDVELLTALGMLQTPAHAVKLSRPRKPAEAEDAARELRSRLGLAAGPLLDLAGVAEKMGVYTYCTALPEKHPDGVYVALAQGGVVLINGAQDSGRRRFTLAHELGHHVFQDQYSIDWIGAGSQDTERLIDAFVVHLLLPRDGVMARWQQLVTRGPRAAALTLGVEYRVSWSVICAQCNRFGLIQQAQYDEFVVCNPDAAELQSLGLSIESELVPPALSPAFKQAIIAAYRKNRVAPRRAIELLRGTVDPGKLPVSDGIPLQAYRGEIELV